MKVFAISDLHLSTNCNKPMDIFGPVWTNYLDSIESSWDEKVGDDDVVLIPGDISWAMKWEDSFPDLDYIGRFKGNKIILRGNHDYWWKSITELREYLPSGMYAIQNDALRIGNIVFCGTRGWTVPEYAHKSDADEKIFNREVIRLKLSLDSMAKLRQEGDTVIVMMHYPPYNSKHESSEFTKLLEQYNVDIVVFGHLHSYDKKQSLTAEINGIKYYLTSCDLVGNKLVDIYDDKK